MKQSVPITFVMIGALLGGGCATKKYVRNTVSPVSGKLDQVAQQTNQQGQKLDQTSQSLDQTKQQQQKDETALSATNERAMTADNKAGQAQNRADQVGKDLGDFRGQVGKDLGDLRSQVANLDDYKPVGSATVLFKFGSDKLSSDAKQQLDQMVANQNQYKRFFLSVEGFTDKTGTTEYNEALSRRRADNVVAYLVAEHNIPVYRIHMVGLGKMKPVDESRGREARAKNRRVEVTLFSADQGAVAMNNGAGGQAQGNNAQTPNTNSQQR